MNTKDTKDPRQLHTTVHSSRRVGGCNFCSRHITASGEIEHHVVKIEAIHQSTNVSFRACIRCVGELIGELQRAMALL